MFCKYWVGIPIQTLIVEWDYYRMTHLPVVRSIVREDVDALSFLAEEFEQYLNSLVEGCHNSSRMTREVFLRDGFDEPPGFMGSSSSVMTGRSATFYIASATTPISQLASFKSSISL